MLQVKIVLSRHKKAYKKAHLIVRLVDYGHFNIEGFRSCIFRSMRVNTRGLYR